MLYALIILLVCAVVLWAAFVIRSYRLKKRHEARLELIASLKAEVEGAFAEVSSFYSYSHYITESERLELEASYGRLAKKVGFLIGSSELDECPDKETFERFYNAMSDTSGHKKVNNRRFIESQLSTYSDYFDTVLSYPLDAQQREAVVSLEDNVLVISSAGSGKTMTTVGKVRYLIDVQNVSPEKILLITFTRKAAESLSERLGEKKLKCRTFHKLALDIIGESTGKRPTLTPDDFSAQVYTRLMENNADFRRSIIDDFIIRARYTMRDQFDYDSREEYMKDRKKNGIRAFFKDMDGHTIFCKSDEESKICDYLGSRGIKFRYEEKYEIDTADSDHRQYHPDFSIYIDTPDGKAKRIYLEHFAINESGHCPPWFSAGEEYDYLQGRIWKKELHKQQGTVLIETTSADFHRRDVFEKLGNKLLSLGAVFVEPDNKNISRELHQQEDNILAMLTSFNFLLKSRGTTLGSVRSKAAHSPDLFTINDIVAPFVEEYARVEKEQEEVDYTDLINQATVLCNNGHRPDYDYILVDEFQDISLDRYRFLQALRRDKPLTKLFCVGDDWQSIYRFAGSDMALFKQFDKFFGYTKRCFMETTYRFGEPAIEKSSKFILSNPEQAIKSVHPFNPEAETQLDFLPTDGKIGIVETVKQIIAQIPQSKEITLLGRYGFDVNVFKDSDFDIIDSRDGVFVSSGGRKMRFMTVHQSKGLESDFVILLNCNGGVIGFPSQISDSPVLKYVLCEPDSYAFSEERRVFYVGITRAKKHTWVLYDEKNPSLFIKEFVQIREDEKDSADKIPESELCPKCRCGRIKIVKKGIAVNGNPYAVWMCSNEKFGCDYIKTTFVNLNSVSNNQKQRKIGFNH